MLYKTYAEPDSGSTSWIVISLIVLVVSIVGLVATTNVKVNINRGGDVQQAVEYMEFLIENPVTIISYRGIYNLPHGEEILQTQDEYYTQRKQKAEQVKQVLESLL